MKLKIFILFVINIFTLVHKPIKCSPVSKGNADVNYEDNTIFGGMNYFHISNTKEFAVVRKLTERENDDLQQNCGYVKKNHLADDETTKNNVRRDVSKRFVNSYDTDFEGRDGFNAIAYAKGKVPDGYSPWTVALGVGNSAFCTGTIISKYHVLTAAHCLFSYDNPSTKCLGMKSLNLDEHTRVYYGGTCLKKSVDNLCRRKNVKERRIRRASYNYHYHLHTCSYGADIAVLEVDHPFEFDNFTQPICMAPESFNEKKDMPLNEVIYTLGYGKTELNMSSVYLRKGNSNVCNNQANYYYDSLSDSFANGVFCLKSCTETDNSKCETFEKMRTGVCRGDSGGPDYVRMNNVPEGMEKNQRYMLIGVHSSGSDCTPTNLTSDVYHHSAKVSYHVKELCWLTGVCPKNTQIKLT
uniref:Peptidase S1 domain-containing protein n=1 Tax=Strongyloides venezuelensis TaxID=75913 RepID=A0A0K0G1G5_STRVS